MPVVRRASGMRPQKPPVPGTAGVVRGGGRVGVFIDVSNVTAYTVVDGMRVDPAALLEVVADGREIQFAYACGSRRQDAARRSLSTPAGKAQAPARSAGGRGGGRTRSAPPTPPSPPPPILSAWEEYWRRAGAHTVCLERDSSNKEQAVDDCIHAAALDFLLTQLELPAGRRGTLALVTGDGNANHGRATSFASVVAHAVRVGVPVEVWTWRASCSGVYRRQGRRHSKGQRQHQAVNTPASDTATAMTVRYLDAFRERLLYAAPARGLAVRPAAAVVPPAPAARASSDDGGSCDSSDDDDDDVVVALPYQLAAPSTTPEAVWPVRPSTGACAAAVLVGGSVDVVDDDDAVRAPRTGNGGAFPSPCEIPDAALPPAACPSPVMPYTNVWS